MKPEPAYSFLTGQSDTPMCELGWRSVGVLELTALPSLDAERWRSWVQAADFLLVNGGDALYLAHWMRESGLLDLLPSLTEAVWVGLSGGSMVMAPRIGEEFGGRHPALPSNTMDAAERWAAKLGTPAYAVDDDTAIVVVDGEVEVVSEGQWRRFDV